MRILSNLKFSTRQYFHDNPFFVFFHICHLINVFFVHMAPIQTCPTDLKQKRKCQRLYFSWQRVLTQNTDFNHQQCRPSAWWCTPESQALAGWTEKFKSLCATACFSIHNYKTLLCNQNMNSWKEGSFSFLVTNILTILHKHTQ